MRVDGVGFKFDLPFSHLISGPRGCHLGDLLAIMSMFFKHTIQNVTSWLHSLYLGGGGLATAPFQPTLIFDDGIFAVLLFFLPEHQNLAIHQQKCFSPRPLATHILNTPLCDDYCAAVVLWTHCLCYHAVKQAGLLQCNARHWLSTLLYHLQSDLNAAGCGYTKYTSIFGYTCDCDCWTCFNSSSFTGLSTTLHLAIYLLRRRRLPMTLIPPSWPINVWDRSLTTHCWSQAL